jgi:hypothetical protein
MPRLRRNQMSGVNITAPIRNRIAMIETASKLFAAFCCATNATPQINEANSSNKSA